MFVAQKAKNSNWGSLGFLHFIDACIDQSVKSIMYYIIRSIKSILFKIFDENECCDLESINDWFDELTDIFKPICFASFKNKQRPSTFRKQASDFYANKNTLSRYQTDEEIFKELDEFGDKFSNADLISSKSNKSVTQEKNSKK